MAVADRLTGKNAKIYWWSANGTADLSGDYRSFDFPFGTDEAESSAGNDTSRNYIPTLQTMEATLNTVFTGTSGTAALYLARPQSEGTLVWAPNGTATGQPKWGFVAFVRSQNYTSPYDNLIEVEHGFGPRTGSGLLYNGNVDKW
jgi:hypothetical protein